MQKDFFYLHDQGICQNQFTREQHVNIQETLQKVGQLMKKSHTKNAKMEIYFLQNNLKKRVIATLHTFFYYYYYKTK